MHGEELKAASLGVGDSIYRSMRYNLRFCGIHLNNYRALRTSIIITMIRANKKIVIKAGGIYHLSYETFNNVRLLFFF